MVEFEARRLKGLKVSRRVICMSSTPSLFKRGGILCVKNLDGVLKTIENMGIPYNGLRYGILVDHILGATTSIIILIMG